jgi:hypothetical protein
MMFQLHSRLKPTPQGGMYPSPWSCAPSCVANLGIDFLTAARQEGSPG